MKAEKLENWIWLELIGFDNTRPDYGVAEYIDNAGFVPEAVCLLVSSADFAMLNPGMDEERVLAPDICSRRAHTHNQFRRRQDWTNYQVRGLLEKLREAGVKSFLSFFTGVGEWGAGHEEVLTRHNHVDHFGGLNVLKRFKDGSFFEDLFAEKVLKAVNDYGFDGWHGPDGFGPHSGAVFNLDFSDDIIGQFQEARGVCLPEEVLKAGEDTREGRLARAEYIWLNSRRDWIEFYSDRWAGFWKKMTDKLHSAGRESVINSAWCRAPWEALYRYGVDYKKFAAAGVDAMVVETCAASLSMDPRPSTSDPFRSYDMYSMLGLVRAYVPGMKLVYLQTTHDIVEEWDAIRHCPTVLEREIFNLNNVYFISSGGAPRRAPDGALTCLGDGMFRQEWRQLNRWLELARGSAPVRIIGATALWSDNAVRAQTEDFIKWRMWDSHRVIASLQEFGAPVQGFASADMLEGISGPFLAVNPHLWSEKEKNCLAGCAEKAVVFIGPELESALGGFRGLRLLLSDAGGERPLQCAVMNLECAPAGKIRGQEKLAAASKKLTENLERMGYWDHLPMRGVSREFLTGCSEIIQRAVSESEGGLAVEEETGAATAMFMELEGGILRVALKNKAPHYARPAVTVPRDISRVEVKTDFPLMAVEPEGRTFKVRVPGKGLTVADVYFK